jgi:hypothetical protein
MLSDGVRQLMEVRAASALGMSASLRTASCSLRNRGTTRWWLLTVVWGGRLHRHTHLERGQYQKIRHGRHMGAQGLPSTRV